MLQKETRGWGYSSVAEHLPSTHKALGSIPRAALKKKRKKPGCEESTLTEDQVGHWETESMSAVCADPTSWTQHQQHSQQ
jgi:hypothetical protein